MVTLRCFDFATNLVVSALFVLFTFGGLSKLSSIVFDNFHLLSACSVLYSVYCTGRNVTNVCVFFINFSTKEKCSFSALHSKTTKHLWCSAGKHAYFCMFFSEMLKLNGLIYGNLLLLDNDFQSNNVVRLHQFIVSTVSLWTIFEYSSDSA